MRLCLGALVSALFVVSPVMAAKSVYTDLTDAACRLVSTNEESGGTQRLCPGVGGYKLYSLDDDARVSIDIVSPDGKEHPLRFWEVISSHFTSHGDKVEWLIVKEGKKSVPRALIVRVNVFEFPEQPDKLTSYLAVSKITGDQVCVTDKIKPGPKQNEQARTAAGMAARKPCLERSGD